MVQRLINIAHKAGEAIMGFYHDEINIELKDDKSPLTAADKAAHTLLDRELRNIIDIPVISEEGLIPEYDERKSWKQYWLIDPLDGTKEFIKRNGEFTVNIALIENKKPVIGIVYLPAKKITYTGDSHDGAYKINGDGRKIRIYSNEPDIQKPVTIVVSRSHESGELDANLAKKGITIKDKAKAGSSLKFCLVAEGTADLYPRSGPTMEWDTAAGDAVYRYSGKNGHRYSPLIYNKPSLKHTEFIIGL